MQSNFNRDDLHLLLDHIPDSEVAIARKILRSLADPVELALLNAPEDDEPLSAHVTSRMGRRSAPAPGRHTGHLARRTSQ